MSNTETEEQLKFIEADIKSNIILRATAGSGKSFSLVERIKFLISKGVDPSKILFFSYTVSAVEEFKKRLNDDRVKITTIHSFCGAMLVRMNKKKPVITIYDFLEWFKENKSPSESSTEESKIEFHELISDMHENAEFISSEISAYKLQTTAGIQCRIPEFITEYNSFLKESKSRDFSDMITEVYECLKENRWLNMFKGKYDYILVDEFQDCSLAQIFILKRLNSKCILCAGDVNQSIFGYSGANVHEVIRVLKEFRDFKDMTLSVNFRSGKAIVENANRYSDLQALSSKDFDGSVNRTIISFDECLKILENNDEVVFLCRTNKVIRKIEEILLLKRIKFNYKNYFSNDEIECIKNNAMSPSTQKKFNKIIKSYESNEELIEFIGSCRFLKSHAKTVHKAKGMEFENCIVVNCFAPDILELNDLQISSKEKEKLTYDPNKEEDFEAKNIFYTAITRPIRSLGYLYLDVL